MTGRALVPLSVPAPRSPGGNAPASFIAQLIETRSRPGRTPPLGSDQALRRYGAAEALATARTRRFERVV